MTAFKKCFYTNLAKVTNILTFTNMLISVNLFFFACTKFDFKVLRFFYNNKMLRFFYKRMKKVGKFHVPFR